MSNAFRQHPVVLDIMSYSPAETIRIGLRLGELLVPGDVVLLYGDFGAGKTHFTKGIAQGLGSADLVNSPSFVLINQYHAGEAKKRVPIYHIDLYRIDDPAALAGIGLEEALDGAGVCVIEWPERADGWLPATSLAVYLSYVSETTRAICFNAAGARAGAIVEALKRAAFA
ncbi:MAG: tRNA (adenosine(37)-N6)-threonylcarbamoyltransferase complex ATPase subunit type 1 TsaE [Roseiflexaceae bacterium]|nr:tRNA (adenosine(37)-N6)-threonylcarbamoyltransferase complex ATPase subunit type 1 TsaE [Roseiflexaceae bacterium]